MVLAFVGPEPIKSAARIADLVFMILSLVGAENSLPNSVISSAGELSRIGAFVERNDQSAMQQTDIQ
jgi:hypothetical protein